MLAITKKTGYGLIAMTHLARLDAGQVASAREISEAFGVPVSLLMNVMKQLAAAGYVESVRGARGGYRLCRDAGEVSVADMIRTIEGPIRLAKCVTGKAGDNRDDVCEMAEKCPIVDPVHRVQRKLREFLDSVTLEEIVKPAASAGGK